MNNRLLATAAVLSTLIGSAGAQSVTPVSDVAARATVTMGEGGKYKTCGLRFVGLDIDAQRPVYPAHGFDFNLVVSLRGKGELVGMLKAELSKITTREQLTKPGASLQKVRTAWVQAEGLAPFAPGKSGIPGENGLSSLAIYPDPEAVIEALLEAAKGAGKRPWLLGIEVAAERGARVYRFTPKVQQDDGATFLACASGLADEMSAAEEPAK